MLFLPTASGIPATSLPVNPFTYITQGNHQLKTKRTIEDYVLFLQLGSTGFEWAFICLIHEAAHLVQADHRHHFSALGPTGFPIPFAML